MNSKLHRFPDPGSVVDSWRDTEHELSILIVSEEDGEGFGQAGVRCGWGCNPNGAISWEVVANDDVEEAGIARKNSRKACRYTAKQAQFPAAVRDPAALGKLISRNVKKELSEGERLLVSVRSEWGMAVLREAPMEFRSLIHGLQCVGSVAFRNVFTIVMDDFVGEFLQVSGISEDELTGVDTVTFPRMVFFDCPNLRFVWGKYCLLQEVETFLCPQLEAGGIQIISLAGEIAFAEQNSDVEKTVSVRCKFEDDLREVRFGEHCLTSKEGITVALRLIDNSEIELTDLWWEENGISDLSLAIIDAWSDAPFGSCPPEVTGWMLDFDCINDVFEDHVSAVVVYGAYENFEFPCLVPECNLVISVYDGGNIFMDITLNNQLLHSELLVDFNQDYYNDDDMEEYIRAMEPDPEEEQTEEPE